MCSMFSADKGKGGINMKLYMPTKTFKGHTIYIYIYDNNNNPC